MPSERDLSAETNRSALSLQEHPATDSAKQVLDEALRTQRADWVSGARTPVVQWLQKFPALAADAALAAELVYHEFVLRQEHEESPDWQEYVRQFPLYA